MPGLFHSASSHLTTLSGTAMHLFSHTPQTGSPAYLWFSPTPLQTFHVTLNLSAPHPDAFRKNCKSTRQFPTLAQFRRVGAQKFGCCGSVHLSLFHSVPMIKGRLLILFYDRIFFFLHRQKGELRMRAEGEDIPSPPLFAFFEIKLLCIVSMLFFG